jgi:hypothetical protein
MKLDSLLSDATALQYMCLEGIRFDNRTLADTNTTTPAARVVLASLKVKEVDERNIDAMLAAFNAVDVKHLLSLDVQNMSSMITLLAANTDNTKSPILLFGQCV